MKERTCAVVYSGGKDGHLALWKALERGYKVSCIIHIDGGSKHEAFFHDDRKTLLVARHAGMMGFPLFVYVIPPSFDRKDYAGSYSGIIGAALTKHRFDTVFVGSTEAEGEHRALLRLPARLRLRIVTPIAGKNIFQIVRECERLKIKPLIKRVGEHVSPSWVGRIFDSNVLEYIRRERRKGNFMDGNDFQTLVISSPLFGRSPNRRRPAASRRTRRRPRAGRPGSCAA